MSRDKDKKIKTLEARVAQLADDICQQNRQLEFNENQAEKLCTENMKTIDGLGSKVIALEESGKEKDAAISRLKAELHNALIDSARQLGYIDRTVEDDAVREIGPRVEMMPPMTAAQSRRSGPMSDPRATMYGNARSYADEIRRRGGMIEVVPPNWFDL